MRINKDITAIQWKGDNIKEIENFTKGECLELFTGVLKINISGDILTATKNSYILKIKESFYTMTCEHFESLYEPT